jgi:hypothetical protein
MQRPYRSFRGRLQQRATTLASVLPPAVRRRGRRAFDLGLGSPLRRVDARDYTRHAAVVSTFDARESVVQLAGDLRATLIERGIELVQLESGGRVLLAVPAEQQAVAVAALNRAPGATRWWVLASGRKPVRLGGSVAPDVRGYEFSVFQRLAAPDGTLIAGPELAVTVQFWDTVTDRKRRPDGGFFPIGTRVAPSRNGAAPYLVPSQWQRTQADPERHVRPGAPQHLLELVEPVDIVYTWVDGDDPAWLRRRDEHVRAAGQLAADALDPARTKNRDELRYSLRSVAMYANWVRHIWLVTDRQVPPWLVADHPRLTVVDHREIFSDPGALPTFNSHAIESQLHHINGLAENFIYLNDDVFFGRPIRPELFFHGNGIAKFAISPTAVDRDPMPISRNGAMLAARRGREVLERDFGRTVTNRMQHVPHAHLRSILAELEDCHPDLIGQVASSRFRSVDDLSVAADFGHYWAYGRGRAVTATFAYRYVDIGSSLAAEQFDSLLARRDQDCFCVNDVGGSEDPADDAQVVSFLSRYFPVPSPFERPEVP